MTLTAAEHYFINFVFYGLMPFFFISFFSMFYDLLLKKAELQDAKKRKRELEDLFYQLHDLAYGRINDINTNKYEEY